MGSSLLSISFRLVEASPLPLLPGRAMVVVVGWGKVAARPRVGHPVSVVSMVLVGRVVASLDRSPLPPRTSGGEGQGDDGDEVFVQRTRTMSYEQMNKTNERGK